MEEISGDEVINGTGFSGRREISSHGSDVVSVFAFIRTFGHKTRLKPIDPSEVIFPSWKQARE